MEKQDVTTTVNSQTYVSECTGNELLITKSKDADWKEVLQSVLQDHSGVGEGPTPEAATRDNNVPRETTLSLSTVERSSDIKCVQFGGVNYVDIKAFEVLFDWFSDEMCASVESRPSFLEEIVNRMKENEQPGKND